MFRRKREMKKIKKKKLFIWLGIIIFLIAMLHFVCGLGRPKDSTIKVQTSKVVRGDITSSVSGSAKIQPEIQVKISAKVSGQIIELGVEEGDYVKKGRFLVQLDREMYQASVEQAESNHSYALAGYRKAVSEYERGKILFESNLISKAELDITKSSYEQAKAQVDQNVAVLKQAKDNLSKTTIYAPMDGTVSQLNKKEGEMAMGSQFTLDVIMVVADLTKMLAETEIDENDVVSVSLGDTSNIDIDAFPDSTFLGVVKEIANTGMTKGFGTQEEVTNFLVKVSMMDRPEGLRPSMSATVDILTDTHKDVLKVPIQSVTVRDPLKTDEKNDEKEKEDKKDEKDEKEVKDENRPSKEKPDIKKGEELIKVLFVVKDGIAHQVPVKAGISSDTEWEIIEGVEEGDEVVSGSYRVLSKQIKDGDVVTIDNTIKKYETE
jgi:HlyD family secretion protein